MASPAFLAAGTPSAQPLHPPPAPLAASAGAAGFSAEVGETPAGRSSLHASAVGAAAVALALAQARRGSVSTQARRDGKARGLKAQLISKLMEAPAVCSLPLCPGRVGGTGAGRAVALRATGEDSVVTTDADGNMRFKAGSSAAAAVAKEVGGEGSVITQGANGNMRFAAGSGGSEAPKAEAPPPEAAPKASAALSEAEQMFREAFEAEQERAKLLRSQLEAALTEKLGTGTKITVDAVEVKTPLTDATSTWRQAFEEAKKQTDNFEQQLNKARGIGAPPPAPAPAAEAAAVDPAVAVGAAPEKEPEPAVNSFQNQNFQGSGMENQMDQVRRLQEASEYAADEESMLRLIAVGVLPKGVEVNFGGEIKPPATLPPMMQAKEALGEADFRVQDTFSFERCYIFKGAVASGKTVPEVLESARSKVRALGSGGATELFVQPAKEDGQSLVLMLLEDDLPEKEVPAWNYAAFFVLLALTFLAAFSTTLAVVPVSKELMNVDPDSLARVFTKCVPTAVGILATVGATEAARRAAAASYGVELSPPFLVPAWPFPSLGALTAVTRRLTPAPNQEAELGMSIVAGVTGLVVSSLLIAYGLSAGPDTDFTVNLNYQLMPVAVKALLKPFLGKSSVTDQPDPFVDPVDVAFPANPVLIGGVCGLMITALSLLPIGRLDGGVLARGALGGGAGFAGFLGLGLLVAGSFDVNDAGTLYLTFGIATLIWQSGAELPPRDMVTEVPGGIKALAATLVVLGLLLSIPGFAFPSV